MPVVLELRELAVRLLQELLQLPLPLLRELESDLQVSDLEVRVVDVSPPAWEPALLITT